VTAAAPDSGRQRKRRQRLAEREAAGVAYQVHHDKMPRVFEGTRLDEHAPGEHVWVVIVTFRTTAEAIELNRANPRDEMLLLDRESLAYVTPPGCYACEQVHTPEIARRPCPGEPR
jgi:hypothetical protein